jgi:hypothetical protein
VKLCVIIDLHEKDKFPGIISLQNEKRKLVDEPNMYLDLPSSLMEVNIECLELDLHGLLLTFEIIVTAISKHNKYVESVKLGSCISRTESSQKLSHWQLHTNTDNLIIQSDL